MLLSKKIFPLNLKRRHLCIPKTYKDRVDVFDTSNNTFFLYKIGRYNNKQTYLYGETSDITIIEFTLHKTLPYYECIINEPIEYHVTRLTLFDKYINNYKINSLPCLSEYENIHTFAAYEDDLSPSALKSLICHKDYTL